MTSYDNYTECSKSIEPSIYIKKRQRMPSSQSAQSYLKVQDIDMDASERRKLSLNLNTELITEN